MKRSLFVSALASGLAGLAFVAASAPAAGKEYKVVEVSGGATVRGVVSLALSAEEKDKFALPKVMHGKDNDKGIRLRGLQPEIVQLGGEYSVTDLLVHDETDATLAYLLSRMFYPEFPVPIGVFRDIEIPIFEDQVRGQIDSAVAKRGAGDLNKLFNSGDTWKVG